MNTWKNKNTPNPSPPSGGKEVGVQTRDRDNAKENILKTYPTKK